MELADLLSALTTQLVEISARVDALERLETPITPGPDNIFYDDLRAPATAVNPPGAASDPDWDSTNIGYLFDAGSTEVLQIIMQMPHTWAEGEDIEPHVHWMPTNTNTGDVLWQMEYKWTNIGDVEAGTFTSVDVVDAGRGTAYTHQLASFGEISGAGKTASSILSIRLSRVGGDVKDTYNADALLKEFDIHYPINSFGEELP